MLFSLPGLPFPPLYPWPGKLLIILPGPAQVSPPFQNLPGTSGTCMQQNFDCLLCADTEFYPTITCTLYIPSVCTVRLIDSEVLKRGAPPSIHLYILAHMGAFVSCLLADRGAGTGPGCSPLTWLPLFFSTKTEDPTSSLLPGAGWEDPTPAECSDKDSKTSRLPQPSLRRVWTWVGVSRPGEDGQPQPQLHPCHVLDVPGDW